MRVHMYVREAIIRLKFEAFLSWLQNRGNHEDYATLMETEDISSFCNDPQQETFPEVERKFERIVELFHQFDEITLNKDEYAMAAFWNSYLMMVQILCDFCKAIKIGDWDLHLHSSEKMMGWFHAYDHFNYARHFSYYWASQQALQDSHPQIYHRFKEGDFSVRRSIGKFNKISPDQAIEQTINKDQKGSGESCYEFFIKAKVIH